MRHSVGGLGGFERGRVVEDGAQRGQPGGGQQVVIRQGDGTVDGIEKVGMDDDGLEVADDQQGRVFQGFTVLQELLVGPVEVGVLALVFQGKVAPIPDIGKALAAIGLAGVGLKAEELAFGVQLGGGGVAGQLAQVQKVLLVAGALVDLRAAPFGDEILGGEGHGEGSISDLGIEGGDSP